MGLATFTIYQVVALHLVFMLQVASEIIFSFNNIYQQQWKNHN